MVAASLQCRRILAGRVDIYIFPSDVQAAILKSRNSGELGRGKKFTKGGREKENLTFCHSPPNSPSLQRIQNSGKTLDRPPKPPALQARWQPG